MAQHGFTEKQMNLVENMEMEMMADVFTKMTTSCNAKCIPPKYTSSELTKGEAVCIDRCVAKFWEVHERVGKRLQSAAVPGAQPGAAALPTPTQ